MEERIDKDLKEAMLKKDALRISTLRMLKAAINNMKIRKKVKRLKDEDIVSIIASQTKQHSESIEQFKKGSRDDLAEKEEKELDILKSYMPEPLSQDEVKELIEEAVKEIDAADKTAFGRIMKEVMARAKGRADGKVISKLVAGRLAGKDG